MNQGRLSFISVEWASLYHAPGVLITDKGIAVGLKNGTVASVGPDGTIQRATDIGGAVHVLSAAAEDQPVVFVTGGSQAAAFRFNQ